MSYGPTQVFTAGIASGASTSSNVDLGGKSFTRLAINAVTMSTGAMITIYGSDSATGTYYPVFEKVANTATSAYTSLTVPRLPIQKIFPVIKSCEELLMNGSKVKFLFGW